MTLDIQFSRFKLEEQKKSLYCVGIEKAFFITIFEKKFIFSRFFVLAPVFVPTFFMVQMNELKIPLHCVGSENAFFIAVFEKNLFFLF